MTLDWIEAKTDRMIAVARRSPYRDEILADAREFHAEGYAMDVALMMALRYWAANPATGKIAGI